jgi:hypothetical protein
MKLMVNPFAEGVSFKKGRFSPLASRRELLSLMGATLIFFLGLPGHSTTFVQTTQHLVKNFVRLVMVFLGLATPVITPPTTMIPPRAPIIKVKAKPPVVVKKEQTPEIFSLNTYSHFRQYTYRFEGKATHQGVACSNASVLVRILSGDKTITKGGFTNEDGTYSIEVPVLATEGMPVDWRVEAFSSEFKKLELSGRRIVQEEEELSQAPILVSAPVEFKASIQK